MTGSPTEPPKPNGLFEFHLYADSYLNSVFYADAGGRCSRIDYNAYCIDLSVVIIPQTGEMTAMHSYHVVRLSIECMLQTSITI